MQQQILKIVEVSKKYKISISTIYRLSAKGEFPQIIKLGERSSGLLESECDQWLDDRIAASRNGEA